MTKIDNYWAEYEKEFRHNEDCVAYNFNNLINVDMVAFSSMCNQFKLVCDNSVISDDTFSIPIKSELSFLAKRIEKVFTYDVNINILNTESYKIENNLCINDEITNLELNTNLLQMDQELQAKIEKVDIAINEYIQLKLKLELKKHEINKIKNNFNYEQYIESYKGFCFLFKYTNVDDFFLDERTKYILQISKYFIPLLKDSQFKSEVKYKFIYLCINFIFKNHKNEIINIFSQDFYDAFIQSVKFTNLKELEQILYSSYAGKIIKHNNYLFNHYQNIYSAYLLLNKI